MRKPFAMSVSAGLFAALCGVDSRPVHAEPTAFSDDEIIKVEVTGQNDKATVTTMPWCPAGQVHGRDLGQAAPAPSGVRNGRLRSVGGSRRRVLRAQGGSDLAQASDGSRPAVDELEQQDAGRSRGFDHQEDREASRRKRKRGQAGQRRDQARVRVARAQGDQTRGWGRSSEDHRSCPRCDQAARSPICGSPGASTAPSSRNTASMGRSKARCTSASVQPMRRGSSRPATSCRSG